MILERETFKRFGYWPHEYTSNGRGKTRKYALACDDCEVVFERSINSSIRGMQRMKGIFCSRCTRVRCGKKSGVVRRKKVSISQSAGIGTEIDPKCWLELFLSVSPKWTRSGDLAGGGTSSKDLRHKYTAELMRAVFRTLDLKFKNITKTEFKQSLLKFLDDQSLSYRFSVANAVFCGVKAMDISQMAYMSVSYKRQGFLLKKAGFDARPSGNGRTTCVYSGSFFKEGRWIHIGD